MPESPFIQRGNCIKNILTILGYRFERSDLQPVEQALETIHELDRLKMLVYEATSTSSVEAFLQKIDATESLVFRRIPYIP